MNLTLDWKAEEVATVFAASMVCLGYVSYFFTAESEKLAHNLKENHGPEQGNVRLFIYQKLSGFLFMGVIPFILSLVFLPLSLKELGLGFQNFDQALLYTFYAALVLVPLNLYNGGKPQSLSIYPQMRIREWRYHHIAITLIGWALYLLGYEFLFRGLLLQTSLPIFGVVPAVAVNVCIYCLVHMPKGIKETLASIPFGIYVCWITLETGTIWAAFFVHFLQAATSFVVSFSKHPDMKLKRK